MKRGMNMGGYHILTLLPIVVVIIFALKTKRTLEALLLGTILSYIITDGANFVSAWTDAFFRAAANVENQEILFMCGLFGSLVALIGASHGTLGFAKWISKCCRGPKSTLIVTWIMGILIFIDDYLNIMTLGTCMKRLSDKRKVPREALAYVIDSTGAPVCVLLPFSTWAVFFATLFYQEAGVAELGYGDAMQTYMHTVPFMFYAVAAVVIVPFFIMNIIPKFGWMKRAYKRVEETGHVYEDDCRHLNEQDEKEEMEEECDPKVKGNIMDFLLPMGVLVVVTIISGELFYAILASFVACFFLYIPRKKMTFGRFCDIYIHGFMQMIPTLAIIFAAFIMQQAMMDIHMTDYIISIVEPVTSPVIYPAIVFLATAVLTFSTGSSWGIPAICIPVMMPLAVSIGADLVLVMGALVSGATLGSHACFYSDATVLTSSYCKIENMEHAISQIPYAALAAGTGLSGYLVCGFLF